MGRANHCSACGMLIERPGEYHPFTMCMLFASVGSESARANLRAVVAYGMYAERAGVGLDEAMNSIRWMHERRRPEPSTDEGGGE